MFTGLVETAGKVVELIKTANGCRFTVEAASIVEGVQLGDSISNNGCCLTVMKIDGPRLSFDLLEETIARTNLNNLRQDSPVNLERALRADGRVGGHFVQGHVDCVAPILAFERKGADFRLEVELPDKSRHYLAFKGSITVDGISLTVAEVLPGSFAAWIIPHTKSHTNLDRATIGDLVNLEFDILAKYVERMIEPSVTKQ
jgi:riboflavin synthase